MTGRQSFTERLRSWGRRRRILRALRRDLLLLLDRSARDRARARQATFEAFRERFGDAFARPLGRRSGRRALVVSVGTQATEAELGLIKGLELAGFAVTVLASDDPSVHSYYELARVRVTSWEDHLASPLGRAARPADDRELLGMVYEGARIGRCAASTTLRALRVGSLDLRSPRVREAVDAQLGFAISAAEAASRVMDSVRPDLVLFNDRGYSPQGELFDICLGRGVDAITWNAAHRSNTVMLKRYSLGNRDEHPASLADASWRDVRALAWTDARRDRVRSEMRTAYARGDWYSEAGTQFGKEMMAAHALREELRLDAGRPCAVIFPHILWDGTFFWGTDLFRSYEEWFIETIRAACAAPQVQWLVKVHPANIVKDRRDRVGGEPAEVVALRERVGSLPGHIRVLPANTRISTYSLFGVMDHCITVRGTVGMEAAAHGVRTLTAGTGRFDRKGFTTDHTRPAEYLEHIRRIDELAPMSSEERELAERFAYGVLVLRPLWLSSLTLEFRQDAVATPVIEIRARTPDEWERAPDLRAFADWAADRTREDFVSDLADG